MTPRTSAQHKPDAKSKSRPKSPASQDTGPSWRVVEARMLDSQPPELYTKSFDAGRSEAPCTASVPSNEILPEYAFLGRSNVGKSSLINAMCNRHKLAYTSATPGKTRLVHRYEITFKHDASGEKKSLILIDLPGYGYAKVSKSMLADWGKGLDTFLLKRKTLKGLLILVDSRHGQKDIDANTRDWAAQFEQPLWIVGTKGDQVTQQITSDLKRAWQPHPVWITSAKTKLGLSALWHSLIETAGFDEGSHDSE